MKINFHSIILIIFGIAIFLMTVAIVGMIVLQFKCEPVKKSVDCYDRYGNKTIGEKCIEKSCTGEEEFPIAYNVFKIILMFSVTELFLVIFVLLIHVAKLLLGSGGYD